MGGGIRATKLAEKINYNILHSSFSDQCAFFFSKMINSKYTLRMLVDNFYQMLYVSLIGIKGSDKSNKIKRFPRIMRCNFLMLIKQPLPGCQRWEWWRRWCRRWRGWWGSDGRWTSSPASSRSRWLRGCLGRQPRQPRASTPGRVVSISSHHTQSPRWYFYIWSLCAILSNVLTQMTP